MRRLEVDRVVVRLTGVDPATARAAAAGLGPMTRRLMEGLATGGSRSIAEVPVRLADGAGPDAVREAIARAVATEVASRVETAPRPQGPARTPGPARSRVPDAEGGR